MFNVQSPRVDDAGIEAEIIAKGKTAPRVTPEQIAATIGSEWYFTALDAVGYIPWGAPAGGDVPRLMAQAKESLGLLTICVLVLRNGFTVTGESACASPENFDAEIGRKIARANAVNKIWALEGYVLKSKPV